VAHWMIYVRCDSRRRIPSCARTSSLTIIRFYESAAAGADALLLIVAALDDDSLRSLRELTEDELAMDALVEVHTRDEMRRAINCGANIIGVKQSESGDV